ncbi:M48 family metallopeptidase [Sphingomonas sp.]|uniref:M48 family metallopeptidase n=1 Tax=Sphingomonas sp. TaxID=28214 RepID=UPI002D13E832|nr:M48 family metallopeptidase [Sphingomonas sp.]HWK35135.1 M48 family metallopeptidase [Sphingomonas sp.]
MATSDDARVWYYDGASALRRDARLVPDGATFTLVEDDRRDGPFAFADLIGHGRIEGAHQYGLKRRSGWRIGLAEPIPAPVAALLPGERRYGGIVDRLGLVQGTLIFATVAGLAVLGLSFAPGVAAKLVPAPVERRLGDLMVGDFGGRTCAARAGAAALQALSDRLGPAVAGADIRVVNVPIVNAVTLPGGHILIFQGLLKDARSPDEVAGVVAHELGHVAHRDVLAALIRQLGLSVLLGGLDGNVGGYTNALLAAGYSRSAEADADGFAIDALRAARISPLGTAAFFARLGAGEAKLGASARVLGYMSSHPLSGERQRLFRASARAGATPALDAAQWAALRTICTADPDVSKTELRF